MLLRSIYDPNFINSVRCLGAIKAISKWEVNLTSGFQATAFISNILHMIQCKSSNCYGGHLGFDRMPKINSVQGLSGIKAISKCEVNLTSGIQDIAFTSINVNLQTAVAAILAFVECPKSIASEVLVVLRPYQNAKSIRQAVFKISHSQVLVNGRMDGPTDRRMDRAIPMRPVFRQAYKKRNPRNLNYIYILHAFFPVYLPSYSIFQNKTAFLLLCNVWNTSLEERYHNRTDRQLITERVREKSLQMH